MAQTLTNRETARDHLVSLMTSQITDYKAVYGYLTKDFDGKSPVACVDTLGTKVTFVSDSVNPQIHRFLVWHYVRRDSEAANEDTLDSLAMQLFQLCRDNVQVSGKWNILQPGDEYTHADYIRLDGVQYRVEGIVLEATISP